MRNTPTLHQSPPSAGTKHPPAASQTTPPPNIRNTTVPPHSGKGETGRSRPIRGRFPPSAGLFCVLTLSLLSDVALAAVLVPVLVMVLTALILIVVCARHWKNRYAAAARKMSPPRRPPPLLLFHDVHAAVSVQEEEL